MGDHLVHQRAGQDLGAADRPDLERVPDRLVLTRKRAGRPGDHHAPNDPDAGDRDGLAGIAELVQEVLDPVAFDGALDRDDPCPVTGVIPDQARMRWRSAVSSSTVVSPRCFVATR